VDRNQVAVILAVSTNPGVDLTGPVVVEDSTDPAGVLTKVDSEEDLFRVKKPSIASINLSKCCK
jgi:hypothetical protein